MRIAVLGVGLIGGSIGLAARRRLDAEVVGYGRSPERLAARGRAGGDRPRRRLASPRPARAPTSSSAARRWRRCPSRRARRWPRPARRPSVTDVGSTKGELVDAVGEDERFIGGHPLAGAETAGVENAREDLFEGARWYLTPTERSSGLLYDRLQRALAALGARPQAIDPQGHDRLMATVSHLPHVLANVLASEAAAVADPGHRTAARRRAELPRRDPRRRLQPGDLGRHLRQQPRGGGRLGRLGRARGCARPRS